MQNSFPITFHIYLKVFWACCAKSSFYFIANVIIVYEFSIWLWKFPFNVFIRIILFILCQIAVPFIGFPFSFFAGLYLILSSVARFSSSWGYYFTKLSGIDVYYGTKSVENGMPSTK